MSKFSLRLTEMIFISLRLTEMMFISLRLTEMMTYRDDVRCTTYRDDVYRVSDRLGIPGYNFAVENGG